MRGARGADVGPHSLQVKKFTPAALKTQRPRDGIERMVNRIPDGHLGVFASLRDPNQNGQRHGVRGAMRRCHHRLVG